MRRFVKIVLILIVATYFICNILPNLIGVPLAAYHSYEAWDSMKQYNHENFHIEKELSALKERIVYKSISNGLVEIKLSIEIDHSFVFFMRIQPQALDEDKDKEETIINVTGIWEYNKKWIRLKFPKDKFLMRAVFDINYADENQFKLINKAEVDINSNLETLRICGVLCDRVQVEKNPD